MHSVKRVKTTAEQRELQRKKEAAEITKYNTLNEMVLDRANWGPGVYRLNTKLLRWNPEHYTAWNLRRERLLERPVESRVEDLEDELQLTQSLLPTHPKVYWLWNHRRWVLAELARDRKGTYDVELALVNKMLERDPRNFHAWAYRRWVVAQTGESSPETELAYTTKKINENFSNFSAWHYRAQLMPALPSRPSLRHELDYVYGAVAMDPEDSSGWIYYQWLLQAPLFKPEVDDTLVETERARIQELWDEEPTVWSGRLLCDIRKMLGEPTDAHLLERMAELDPLRKNAYAALAKA